MTIDTEDLLNSIWSSLEQISHIPSEDIPNIDLYMDQVTTFMDRRLRSTTRNPQEDKILTKTMINNYAKNDLLPAPEKKKYSKDHLIMLIFIYYFKGVLSIGDIQTILGPVAERFFHTDGSLNMQAVYDEVLGLEKEQVQGLKDEIYGKYETAQKTFADAESEDREFLRFFSFISLLSYDVYVKKLLIEKMIDGFQDKRKRAEEEEKAKGGHGEAGGKAKSDHGQPEKPRKEPKKAKAERGAAEKAADKATAQDKQAKLVKSKLEAQSKK